MILVPPLPPQWSSSRRAVTTTALVSLLLHSFRNYYSSNPAGIKGVFEARDPSSRVHVQIPSSYQEPQPSNAASTAEAPISRTSIPDDATILYIGHQTLALTNLLMTHGDKNVCLTQLLIVIVIVI